MAIKILPSATRSSVAEDAFQQVNPLQTFGSRLKAIPNMPDVADSSRDVYRASGGSLGDAFNEMGDRLGRLAANERQAEQALLKAYEDQQRKTQQKELELYRKEVLNDRDLRIMNQELSPLDTPAWIKERLEAKRSELNDKYQYKTVIGQQARSEMEFSIRQWYEEDRGEANERVADVVKVQQDQGIKQLEVLAGSSLEAYQKYGPQIDAEFNSPAYFGVRDPDDVVKGYNDTHKNIQTSILEQMVRDRPEVFDQFLELNRQHFSQYDDGELAKMSYKAQELVIKRENQAETRSKREHKSISEQLQNDTLDYIQAGELDHARQMIEQSSALGYLSPTERRTLSKIVDDAEEDAEIEFSEQNSARLEDSLYNGTASRFDVAHAYAEKEITKKEYNRLSSLAGRITKSGDVLNGETTKMYRTALKSAFAKSPQDFIEFSSAEQKKGQAVLMFNEMILQGVDPKEAYTDTIKAWERELPVPPKATNGDVTTKEQWLEMYRSGKWTPEEAKRQKDQLEMRLRNGR